MGRDGCLVGAAGSWYDISLISVSFLVAFSAYNTIQSLATTFLPGNLGSVSLGILYATVAIGVWLSPGIAQQIGLKWSLVLGLATYVVYEASLIKINYWVVVAASVVIGSGSGVLWVAVGQKIADASKNGLSLGLANGVFWGVFQVNGVLGPLLAYFVLPKLHASSSLFVMFTAFGAAGTLLSVLLRSDSTATDEPAAAKAPGSQTEQAAQMAPLLASHGSDAERGESGTLSSATAAAQPSAATSEEEGFWAVVWRGVTRAMTSAFTDWRVRLLAPLFFLTGWELAFWSGEFPQVITKHDVPLTATVVGVGEVTGGFVFGWLSDRIGRLAVVSLASAVYCAGLVLVMVARAEVEYDSESGEVSRTATSLGPVLGETALGLYAAGLCFGLGDSGLYTQCLAVIGDVFPDEGGTGGSGHGAVVGDPAEGGASGSLEGKAKERGERIQGGAVSVDVFAMFQFLNNIGSAVGFLLQVPAPLLRNGGVPGTPLQVWLLFGVFLVSVLGFLGLDLGRRGAEGGEDGGEAGAEKGLGGGTAGIGLGEPGVEVYNGGGLGGTFTASDDRRKAAEGVAVNSGS